MKKVIMAIIFAFVAFTGCTRSTITSENSANAQTDEQTSSETTEETAEETEAFSFYNLEYDRTAMIEFYRFEVSRRLRAGGNFITAEEKRWYEENDYEITNEEDGVVFKYNSLYNEGHYYRRPIVVFYEWENQPLYVNEDGNLIVDHEIIDNANLTYEERQEIGDPIVVTATELSTTVYKQDEELQLYTLGHKTETIPIKGVYCGRSMWVGFIFRYGSDVYAVSWNGETESYDVKVIAHHVKYVITADYRLGSDPWSQPLFLMEDGTIKAYLDWNNKEVPDSEENLVEPFYEGGYFKTW